MENKVREFFSSKKNTTIFTIVVLMLLISFLAISYAFRDTVLDGTELLDYQNTPSYNIAMYKKGNINIDTNNANFNAELNSNASTVVSLDNYGNSMAKCTYDIIFEWDNDYYNEASNALTGQNPYELSIKEEYLDEIDMSFLPSYIGENNKYQTIVMSSSMSVVGKKKLFKEYSFDINLYKNGDNKNTINKSLNGYFKVDNINCTEVNYPDNSLSSLISSFEGNDYVSSQDKTNYKVVSEIALYNNKEYDAGIRYEGKDPDNYVLFNNEMYRIIGVFNINDNLLTKIIRNEAIYNDIFDDDANTFSSSMLYDKLNITYYNNISNKYKKLIENSKYYMGSSNDSDNTYSSFVKERNEKDAFNANISLMYFSDYAYSFTETDICKHNMMISGKDFEKNNCDGLSWLRYENPQYTVTPYENSNGLIRPILNGGGKINAEVNVNSMWAVRPVMYLKSNVKVVSGDGSFENPYEIE